jgi:hypothetical protein
LTQQNPLEIRASGFDISGLLSLMAERDDMVGLYPILFSHPVVQGRLGHSQFGIIPARLMLTLLFTLPIMMGVGDFSLV